MRNVRFATPTAGKRTGTTAPERRAADKHGLGLFAHIHPVVNAPGSRPVGPRFGVLEKLPQCASLAPGVDGASQ
jgi:hypothetical protein